MRKDVLDCRRRQIVRRNQQDRIGVSFLFFLDFPIIIHTISFPNQGNGWREHDIGVFIWLSS